MYHFLEGDGGDDAPIIPIVNPHTETDLAADEDGDVIKTMDVSKLLQCSWLLRGNFSINATKFVLNIKKWLLFAIKCNVKL